MAAKKPVGVIPGELIERRIFLLRGEQVMLSTDLARLYEVEPRALLQAVKRNAGDSLLTSCSSSAPESSRSWNHRL